MFTQINLECLKKAFRECRHIAFTTAIAGADDTSRQLAEFIKKVEKYLREGENVVG